MDIAVTSQNGTKVTEIAGIGGHKLIESPNRPDDQYGVEIAIVERTEDYRYNYSITSEQFEPAN